MEQEINNRQLAICICSLFCLPFTDKNGWENETKNIAHNFSESSVMRNTKPIKRVSSEVSQVIFSLFILRSLTKCHIHCGIEWTGSCSIRCIWLATKMHLKEKKGNDQRAMILYGLYGAFKDNPNHKWNFS